MRKSTLVKNILIIGGLLSWTWFCAVKIPEYQETNRKQALKTYAAIMKEHEDNYIDIKDTEGNIHSVPREEYEIPYTVNLPISLENSERTDILDRLTTYSHAELKLLAQLVESEAGIESYQCKLYVASVVDNRRKANEFPDSIEEVIFERTKGNTAQFSVTIVRSDGTRAIDCEPSQDSWDAAKEILTNGSVLPEDVHFFYASYCNDRWLSSLEKYGTVDHTIFAYYWRGQ